MKAKHNNFGWIKWVYLYTIVEEWSKIQTQLPKLTNIKFPRHCVGSDVKSVPLLHAFFDALT